MTKHKHEKLIKVKSCLGALSIFWNVGKPIELASLLPLPRTPLLYKICHFCRHSTCFIFLFLFFLDFWILLRPCQIHGNIIGNIHYHTLTLFRTLFIVFFIDYFIISWLDMFRPNQVHAAGIFGNKGMSQNEHCLAKVWRWLN